ncbi:MAG: serine--tRNA ligase [Acidobacteriota bacterium]
MIDLKRLRAAPDAFRASLGRKRFSAKDLDRVLEMDAELRQAKQAVEELRARRNATSRKIPRLTGEEKIATLAEMKKLAAELKEREPELKDLEERVRAAAVNIPNPPSPDAPDGIDETSNKILREVGRPPIFDFTVRDHVEIGELRDWIDVKRGARTSGTRFAYLKGEIVDLQFALVRLALDTLSRHQFRPVVPPIVVRESAMYGTGFFPADRNEIYKLDGEDGFLVGTSEVPLAALHMNETLDAADLPTRYAGVSTCLRREAGTYGKDTRGIFRVHQFDKVEMFSFCSPEDSTAEHDRILSIEEEILQGLELPYRVVNVCTGDLGAPAAKKYDLEAWLPGQGTYRELTSCSNCTDFQARRLGVRARFPAGTALVHTLNGTAIAIGRTLIALLENHQQSDGRVSLPAVLRPYLGGVDTL